jgi:hypothetical protein
MSAETDAKIKEYTDAKDAAYKAYSEELTWNTMGHANAKNSNWTKPYNNQVTTQADFMAWLSASDASLAIKKTNWQNAVTNLESYLKQLDQSTINAAVASNPNLLTDLAKAKEESELNKGKQLFAQATTKYLIWGAIALVVIVIGVIIYKKKFAK